MSWSAELERTRGEVTRLDFELRSRTAEAELDKLRAIESLRQEMDMDRRQVRREREQELAQHWERRRELLNERDEQLRVYKPVLYILSMLE